jgi:C1A family cysteine protease
MKRVFLALFFIATCTSLAMAAPTMMHYSNKDADSSITLNRSSVAVIELLSNPSTGYSWRVKSSLGSPSLGNPSLGNHIRILATEFEASRTGLRGSKGKEKIYVVGAEAGSSELVLEYGRAHEQKIVDSIRYKFETKETFTESFSLPSSTEQELLDDTQTQVGSGNLGLPTAFNWCDQNGCTPVKDQGNCGSCWAFATVSPLESLIKINDGETVDLSEQYLVSCNDEGWGCDGGFWAHDYHQYKKVSGEYEAGAVQESNFPYQASDATCNPPHEKSQQITSWQYVCGSSTCKPSTDQIQQAIYEHGPITVSVCANDAMSSYSGGVFSGPSCNSLNHAVVLVGWNDSEGAWIMRNSWGSSWGESGYMRIGYGVSGIGSDAAYVEYGETPTPDPDPDPAPEPDPSDGKIENGQTIADLSAEQNDWLYFNIDIPENAVNLSAKISGGSGDADLYARFGAEPTSSEYDCRPYITGNNETCTQKAGKVGKWYIGLNAYSGFSGVSVTVSYQDGASNPEPVGQCVTANNLKHLDEGRAYHCGVSNWQACAVGSGDNLDWAFSAFSKTTSLKETAVDYWKRVESCQ